jgi:hypothetical protein
MRGDGWFGIPHSLGVGFFALLLAGTVLFQRISEDIQKSITIRDSLVSIADLKG